PIPRPTLSAVPILYWPSSSKTYSDSPIPPPTHTQTPQSLYFLSASVFFSIPSPDETLVQLKSAAGAPKSHRFAGNHLSQNASTAIAFRTKHPPPPLPLPPPVFLVGVAADSLLETPSPLCPSDLLTSRRPIPQTCLPQLRTTQTPKSPDLVAVLRELLGHDLYKRGSRLKRLRIGEKKKDHEQRGRQRKDRED
ncbi:unnamed protein product, partial [Linum tenue]